MHDCPACRVPLHGYEEVCPSCGTRQVVRKGSGRQFSSFKPEQPGINWMPFVLTFFVVGVIIVLGMSSSWVGKLVRGETPKDDPMDKMTFTEARNLVEQELTNGLTAAGAPPKLTWQDTSGEGKPADKAIDQPENLNVDVSMPDPNARKPIIDKVKDYLEKAKIPTLTMNDSKTHAHWTYNMVKTQSPQAPDQ